MTLFLLETHVPGSDQGSPGNRSALAPVTDYSTLKRPIIPMPDFVSHALEERGVMEDFKQRPAYQQNDYLAWIMRARREKTRQHRLGQMLDELAAGGLYMKMTHAPSMKCRPDT